MTAVDYLFLYIMVVPSYNPLTHMITANNQLAKI